MVHVIPGNFVELAGSDGSTHYQRLSDISRVTYRPKGTVLIDGSRSEEAQTIVAMKNGTYIEVDGARYDAIKELLGQALTG